MPLHVSHRPEPQSLRNLVKSRPFVRQLDVIIADSEELAMLLSAQRHSYHRSIVTFAEVFLAFDANSPALVCSVGSQDVWSIDHRAILTLTLTRDAHESLGITGSPLGPARYKDMFLVTLDLHDDSRRAVRARECLRQWDTRRADAGQDGWDVLLSSPLRSGGVIDKKWDVESHSRVSQGVRIPSPVLPSLDSEDAQEELSTLFEWVGLVCVGSPRLHAIDAINPYVASCAFPASWRVGSLTHVRWEGLLMPAFVQSVLDTCMSRASGLVAMNAVPMSCGGNNAWTLVALREPESAGMDCILADFSN